ncbi:MAG TPA: hypothetical protein VNA66_01255, partial [Gammaproteobacteria bacterium]|nr:hypothetical protein [Gammaproteobacteria bacterium]
MIVHCVQSHAHLRDLIDAKLLVDALRFEQRAARLASIAELGGKIVYLALRSAARRDERAASPELARKT